MTLKLYPEEDVQNIANAIRSRNGASNLYKIGDMASEIESLNTVGNKELVENLIHGSVVNFNDPYVTKIDTSFFLNYDILETVDLPACMTITMSSAFYNCSALTTVNLPACMTIMSVSVFATCHSLTTVNLPACTYLGTGAFESCYALTTVNLPACSEVGSRAFRHCSALTTISLPACTSIYTNAFAGCKQLSEIYLCSPTVCKLHNSSVFNNSGIKKVKEPFMSQVVYIRHI